MHFILKISFEILNKEGNKASQASIISGRHSRPSPQKLKREEFCVWGKEVGFFLKYRFCFTVFWGETVAILWAPIFVILKVLNGERSQLAQSFEYNYGDFIPILPPFFKVCQEVKDRRLALFKEFFPDVRK